MQTDEHNPGHRDHPERDPFLLGHIREVIRYRELIFNLVVRELRARYKNSVLGFFWSLLNPLGMMLVFTFVFTVMWPNNQIDNYPIFFLCGFLPWQFFSAGVMTSMYSIIGNSSLVKKVYFPARSCRFLPSWQTWSTSCWPWWSCLGCCL